MKHLVYLILALITSSASFAADQDLDDIYLGDTYFNMQFIGSIGLQTGHPQIAKITPYIAGKLFLFQNKLIPGPTIGGFGASLNTSGEIHILISPYAFTAGPVYFMPEVGIGVNDAPSKIGFSVGLPF